MIGFLFGFLLFFLFIGLIIYDFSQRGKYKLNYQQHIESTGFNPSWLLTETLTKTPIFGIDVDKQLFYIFGQKKDSKIIFHASEVTNISLGPSEKSNKWELTFTVIDLVEPKRYVYFGGRKAAEEWYGRVQAIWNSN